MKKHSTSIMIGFVGIILACIIYVHEANKPFENEVVQQENVESIVGTYRCNNTETIDGKKYTFVYVFKKDHTFTDITFTTDVVSGKQNKTAWPGGTYTIVEANSHYPYDRLYLKCKSGSTTTVNITINRDVFQDQNEALWVKQD